MVRNDDAIDSVLDYFGNTTYICCDYRDFASHSFQRGQAEGFELRREEEEVGGGELFVNGVLLAEEKHILLQFLFSHEIFGGAAIRAVAD